MRLSTAVLSVVLTATQLPLCVHGFTSSHHHIIATKNTLFGSHQRLFSKINNGPSTTSTTTTPSSERNYNPTLFYRIKSSARRNSNDNNNDAVEEYNNLIERNGAFDLTTALFCGGLAFDAYAEPPPNSSRWERGSSGCNVAFQSPSFTRSMYKGLLQVKPIKCTDLPDEDNTAEELMTGSGTDAYLLVAVAEGKWKEDIKLIENERYNDGVLALQGCAHVGRSSTAWSNVNENKARADFKKGKGSGAYHIKSSWGRGGQAIWEADESFYLYVQDPADARLVFTVMDDDVVGSGSPIGSTSRKLADILPASKIDDPVSLVKDEVIARMKRGEEVDLDNTEDLIKSVAQEWDGDVKLTSKPRKKDKNGQIAAAAAAGAMVAGPVGAAIGGIAGSLYEGEARGRVFVNVKYMPIPNVATNRQKYKVKGGLPGVDWGELYERRIKDSVEKLQTEQGLATVDPHLGGNDLEFCCHVTHDKTGCSCAIYRSLEKKLIAISFRGTCELVDLVTDASIIQETWVEGEDIEKEDAIKVHVGFRKSLNSISRKLKELLLATVAPGDDISDYDLVVTGHSLGGALSTLFTADIGEYGIDAGRGLPQLEESEPWWSSLASTFFGEDNDQPQNTAIPRPKSLKMYNFGSPRVGNKEFTQLFDSLVGNGIDEAYRIVNGQDVVARLPRTVNALNIVSIGYEHCGPTVLISIPEPTDDDEQEGGSPVVTAPLVWIEGISEGECPVRDGTALRSPLAQGSLLGDIVSAVKEKHDTNKDNGKEADYLEKGDVLAKLTTAVKDRFETFSASDLASVVGIDQQFIARESKIIQSVMSGEALSHHMEDQYYSAMGRASGFIAVVGEDIEKIENEET